ncbi:Histone acetyltransferase [Bertholletia excelsa]
MLFNKEIEALHDDGFDGSLDESCIFKEVFFGNDCDTNSKRCVVTGVINFECDYGKKANTSLCFNSENSAIHSQVDSCNIKEDSRENSTPGCFSDGYALVMKGDHDMNDKRLKLSADQLYYSQPCFQGTLNLSAPLRRVIFGMPEPASQSVCHTVTCRLVESSSKGVTSSCYLLKRNEKISEGEPSIRDLTKCRLQNRDGSDEKEVNVGKAIASPVSQESVATKLLVAKPAVVVAEQSGSHQYTKQRKKASSVSEQKIEQLFLNRDSMKDPRPLLRSHVQNLLRDAGWQIGRRKRGGNIIGEYIYLSPGGARPIREFHRAWKLCGQSLFADGNIVVQEDQKQWTDMIHFWADLSNTIEKIENELKSETTAVLANRWYILDPFANMVFIEKKLGKLKEGKVVTGRRSLAIATSVKADALLALKNVDTIAEQSERHSPGQLCNSSFGRESALTVPDRTYHLCKEKCNNKCSACLGQLQRGATETLKVQSVYHSDKKHTLSYNIVHGKGTQSQDISGIKRSRQDLSSSQSCGSAGTCDHLSSCLIDVPVTSGNDSFTCRHEEIVSTNHYCNICSSSYERNGSDHSEETLLETLKFTSVGSSGEGKIFCGEVIGKMENQLTRFVGEHISCKNDGLAHCVDQGRIDMPLNACAYDVSKPWTSGWTGGSCKKQFICPSQRKSGRKSSRFSKFRQLSRYRKFRRNSGSPKKYNQFSSEDLKFDNITDLHMKNEFLHPEVWMQGVRSEKPDNQNERGQKNSMICQLKDDDLLISAIIKSKSFGSSPKQMKSRRSEALRKRKSQKGSCRLLPRSLGKGGKHIEGKWSIFGCRTVLSWLIASCAVSINEVIQYRNPKDGSVVKDGLVTQDGILCKCCNKVLSVSEFKSHAGFKLNRPCLNLFMESGKPFTLCQLEAWSAEYKARKNATRTVRVKEIDQNDDSCGLCGDGGELICCDNCPSTFHQACLCAEELPEGSWYCAHCTCRICGDVVNDEEPLKSPGGSKCSQCEHKYHKACLKLKGMCGQVASDTWFCSESCQEVYFGLQSRIGSVNLLSDGFSWTLLKCIHGDQRAHSAQKIVALKAECNSKLAVALTIMEECFLSMVDPRTGIDMIPHVVYNWGSEFARLNYLGFHTAVLEKDDVLISVAAIRIHGVTVAEMPLIATCSKYRRQGMCRRLMNSIEEMLKSFKVEKLVITAIPSLVETWTVGFGFEPLEDEEGEA